MILYYILEIYSPSKIIEIIGNIIINIVQTNTIFGTLKFPIFLTYLSMAARGTSISNVMLNMLVDISCSTGRNGDVSGSPHLSRKKINGICANPIYAKFKKWIFSQAFNLGFGCRILNFPVLSRRYNMIKIARSTIDMYSTSAYHHIPRNKGTVRNEEITAKNWHTRHLE